MVAVNASEILALPVGVLLGAASVVGVSSEEKVNRGPAEEDASTGDEADAEGKGEEAESKTPALLDGAEPEGSAEAEADGDGADTDSPLDAGTEAERLGSSEAEAVGSPSSQKTVSVTVTVSTLPATPDPLGVAASVMADRSEALALEGTGREVAELVATGDEDAVVG